MTKYLIFRPVVMLCFCLCLITAGDLFSQTTRDMKTITVRTQQGKEIELYKDSYALVVGNGSYAEGWPRLPGVLQDVDEVADALEAHGFSVTLKKDLTKPEFEKAFADFVVNAGADPDNRLLFYYAGHGYTQRMTTGKDLGYLVMVDAPVSERDKVGFELKSIPTESLVTQTEKILARHALFIFDSCFSGTILNMRDRFTPPESISDRVKQPVRQFITAGRANEQVPSHSVFKQEFLDLIQGKAADPLPDGYITGAELGAHLAARVPQYNNGAQHPQYGKIMNPNLNKGDFVFVLPGYRQPPQLQPPQTGSVFITSEPPGAQVTLAGVLQTQRTPVRIQDVMAGTHMLKLTLENYEDYTQQVIVEAGREVQINPTLRRLPPRPPVQPPQTGSIFVTSEPPGAQVTLADVLQTQRTPVRIQDVMAGTHMLKLTLEDYEDYTQRITIEAGREAQVNSTLRRLPARPPAPRSGRSKWPFIIGGVVAASGAGVAAYIISNSNDNEGGSGGGIELPPEPRNGDLTISISIP